MGFWAQVAQIGEGYAFNVQDEFEGTEIGY